MRVIILEKCKKSDLQHDINNMLEHQKESNIVDIKYSGYGCYTPYGTNYYSAMIILKE